MVTTRAQSRSQSLIIDINSPFQLRYFDEGAAHIVYEFQDAKISLPLNDEDFASRAIHPALKGMLLRLRKDLPSVIPVKESHDYFRKSIEPLFPGGH